MLSIPQLVLAAASGWATLYFILRQVIPQEPEWTIRVVTLFHAVLINTLAVIDWTYLRPWASVQFGTPNTSYEVAVLAITLGYFLVDLLWVMKYQSKDRTMYAHHLSSIISVSYILASGVSGVEALHCVSLLETTNPCLQARWFLRSHGYQGTRIHTTAEVIFMASFIILRIGYGTYLMTQIVPSPMLHTLFKLGAVSLQTVSLIFTYQMFSYVAKKYFNYKSR